MLVYFVKIILIHLIIVLNHHWTGEICHNVDSRFCNWRHILARVQYRIICLTIHLKENHIFLFFQDSGTDENSDGEEVVQGRAEVRYNLRQRNVVRAGSGGWQNEERNSRTIVDCGATQLLQSDVSVSLCTVWRYECLTIININIRLFQ